MTIFRLGWEGIFDLVRSDLPWLLWITSAVTWACWGSFLQAVSYRIPAGISIVVPESHCPGCKKKLLFQDNLPIIGWITLKGKCRFCHMVIPFQYLWMEILMGLLGILFAWITLFELNDPAMWLWSLMMVSWLLVIGVIDWNHRYIPDGVCLTPLIVGVYFALPNILEWKNDYFWMWSFAFWLSIPVFTFASLRGLLRVFVGESLETQLDQLYESKKVFQWFVWLMAAAPIAFLVTRSGILYSDISGNYIGATLGLVLLYVTRGLASKIAGQEAMGLGDVKMAMVLGWWFGPLSLMFILGSACVLGVIVAMIQKLRKKESSQPFGTMMAMAAFFIGVVYPFVLPILKNYEIVTDVTK